MWHKELELAIIEKDVKKIESLLAQELQFENQQQMRDAQILLLQAAEFLGQLKGETLATMKRIKKSLDFMNSSQEQGLHKLDIRS